MQPQITLIPEKPQTHRNGTPLHILIQIQVPAAPSNPARVPLNLSLVIDRSGSMEGDKLEYAKAAARYVLQHLEPTDRVSLVAFDDRIEIPLGSTLAQRVNVENVLSAVSARGSTHLHGGWLEGGTQVASHLNTGGLNRVMLLSDGIANVGETNTDRIASDVRGLASRGISTSALGVGRDFNEDLMQAIALSGDGNYHFIEHPSQLPHLFAAELAGLKNTFAQNVTLGLEVSGGVKVLDVLNDAPRNEKGQWVLPNLLHGATLEILVKLELPAVASSQTLETQTLETQTLETQTLEVLRVRLEYSPAVGGVPVVQREAISLLAVEDAAYREQKSDPRVLESLALLEVARAKAEVVAMLDRGQDAAIPAYVQQYSTLLAAAPATPKIAQEIAALEGLNRDLTQDRTITRKRANAQRYEKQRGQ